MIHPYFIENSILSLFSGVVALAVSYYAFRYRRVTGSSFLRLLSVGFMLLGVGLLVQGSIYLLAEFNVGRFVDREALVYGATGVYLVLQSAAYLLIGTGYTIRVQRGASSDGMGTGAAVLAVQAAPLLFGTLVLDIGELVILVLVSFVVFQGAMAYSELKNRLSLYVLLGFAFIALSHLGELLGSLLASGDLYLLGGTANLAGFCLLLLFVVRSGRIGSV
ncbi:MAG: hypothetical protein JRM79_00045 [Nitrososphaerota archaeon]|nr:hypothetical protein [Nitrososphaerota archaeon]MDG6924636.1 hypothetical protein [Nitrososphaerota archaeon]MDG6941198.1 hypothetical protein [Nitrososphaerota archaeon]MDG6945746.1 hypothetical protein [Nitrososphaerota archaeon]MDG6952347.1 hypothetical protein [Nitrososphaerota archaeon]